jgi:hypothetical protein
MHAICPSYLTPSGMVALAIIGSEYKVRNFLHPPVTSSLLGPYILLSTLFSNTPNPFPSLMIRDKFSYPYNIINKIMVPYNSIVTFSDRKCMAASIPRT